MDTFKLTNPQLSLKNLIYNTTNLGNLTNRNNNSISKKILNNHESDNNYSINSTGFSNIKKNKPKKKEHLNILLTPRKNDYPNNFNENEKKKIKEMFSKLSLWDEKLEKKKFKNLKIIESYNKESKKKIDLMKKKEEFDGLIEKNLFNYKLPKVSSFTHIRNDSQRIDKKKVNLFFEEKTINLSKKIDEKFNNNNFTNIITKKEYENQIEKEQKKTEFKQRRTLMEIYEKFIINKLKQKRYESIKDDTYHLLDNARTEYQLCTDILKERIKSVEKYYEAFINSYNNNEHLIEIQNDEEIKTFNNENIDEQIDNTTELKKKFRKKRNYEILEEKIKKYNEYTSIKEDLLSEIKEYDDRFSLINEQLSKIIKNSDEKIKECNEEGTKYKYLFNELNNEQKKYYLDILKKGNDIRNEGLSWVIKRLIELKVNLKEIIFPPFLDNEQIEYLINISKLSFERNQLILILNTLKRRQKRDRSNSVNNINNFNERKNKENICKYVYEMLKPGKFSKKIIEQMQKLYLKYEECTWNLMENKIKNLEMNEIVLKNKSQLHLYAFNKNVFDFDNDADFLHNLIEEQKQNIYFNDIIKLNARIKELDIFINRLIKEEKSVFENKIKLLKLKNGDFIYDFKDKVYKALFGTSKEIE